MAFDEIQQHDFLEVTESAAVDAADTPHVRPAWAPLTLVADWTGQDIRTVSAARLNARHPEFRPETGHGSCWRS